MESNREQTLVEIEQAFENAKAERMKAKIRWEANKGKYHTQLVARREAGEKITVSDIKALEAAAIDDIPEVKSAYLDFINKDGDYRFKKVQFEEAKRAYWDAKPFKQ